MIRVKAKNWFILAIVAILSFCLFGCEESTIETESISFVDESINLLVGDSAFPEVKVLPSYATDKSYTLISGDITALRVDGLKVVGLKAMRGVSLKVVSNDNSNLNDVIMVNIFEQTMNLSTPEGKINFNGAEFSFNAVDNAYSYVLKVEGADFTGEFNIGNNTTYSWDALEQNAGRSLMDRAYSYSVKAVGDGSVYNDSAYGEKFEFVNVSSVSNIDLNGAEIGFTSVENVKKYSVKITNLLTNRLVDKLVESPQTVLARLTVDISDVVDEKNNGEYKVEISALKDDYALQIGADKIFIARSQSFNFKSLGQVQNVGVNNRVISWDLLKGADEYDLYLFKDGAELTTITGLTVNSKTFDWTEAGNYSCEVIARSNDARVLDATMRSQTLDIKVLTPPTITASLNTISWAEVDDAGGYLVYVKNADNEVIENKRFVLNNYFNVSSYGAGEYFIEVESYGNGEQVITSAKSSQLAWKVLGGVLELGVQDKKLNWKDEDANSLNSYQLVIQKQGVAIVDKSLTSADLNENYTQSGNTFSYNLGQHNFEAGEYEIKLLSAGANNVFSSKYSTLALTKLADSQILGISNGTITIKPVEKAVSYVVKVYNSSDVGFVSPLTQIEVEDNSAVLNQQELTNGSYVARVFTFGQGNILDADNNVENMGSLDFMKLKTPVLELDKTSFAVKIKDYSEESSYQFMENATEKQLVAGEYELLGLTAGEYTYRVKALGNNSKILDSDFTQDVNAIKVRKIRKPEISFNKRTLTFSITCQDQQYISKYNFKINGSTVSVENGVADCSSIIVDGGNYEVELTTTVNEYDDLFVIGETVSMSVDKLAGSAMAEIQNGQLIITPSADLTGENYLLSLKIKNLNGDELILQGFTYQSNKKQFVLDIYDSEFNVKNIQNDLGVKFFDSEDTYTLFATIDNQDGQMVASNEQEVENKIHILDKVTNIHRNVQKIEFNSVANATGYIAYLTDVSTHYFEVMPNYSGEICSLDVAGLQELMKQNQINYVEGFSYTIGFVAVSSNAQYVPSKSAKEGNYSFEFLRHPEIQVVEGENNAKYLVIKNTNSKVTNYNVILSQGEMVKQGWYTRTTTDTRIDLSAFTQFNGGEIQVKVKASADTGNYFESSESNLSVEKLACPIISTENGVLVWDAVENAKLYNLYYTKYGSTQKIALNEQSENFVIENGKCKYDFVGLDEGLVSVYLQVDAVAPSGNIYVNSNNGQIASDVYKLSGIKVSVINGKIAFEFKRTDWELANKIELLVDGEQVGIDFLEYLTSGEVEDGASTAVITRDGEQIIKYVSVDILTKEKLGLKYYTSSENVLNSSVAYKDIAGLISPANLNINTSTSTTESLAIKEVLEKITWANPAGNLNYVEGYRVVVEYNEQEYEFETGENWLMMPKFDDANSNGELDEGEVEFGAGTYKIKVMSLAIDTNNDYVVDSRCSEQIEVVVLDTPTKLKTETGNLAWEENVNAEYFLVRVYLVNGENRSLIASTRAGENNFDLTLLDPFENGIYAVTVQAMHDGLKVLASDESDEFEVIRLPQVEEYYINQGQLWVKAHSFFSEMEIYLRKADTGELLTARDGTLIKFSIKNQNQTAYSNFTQGMTSWSASNVLATYTDSEYFNYYRYVDKYEGYTLTQALADGYLVDVKLIGNSSNKASIISGHTAVDIPNVKFEGDLVKLEQPNVAVSTTVVGQVNFKMMREYRALKYYINGETSLRGAYLYEVSIKGDGTYNMYVAEIYDDELFAEAVPVIEQDDETKHNLKHFTYNGQCFNVLDSLSLDFTLDEYYYYKTNGEYSWINFNSCGSFIVNVRLLGDDTQFATSSYSKAVNIYRYRILNITVKDGKLSWMSQANVGDYPVYVITLTNSDNEYNLVLYNPDVQDLDSVQSCLNASKTYIYDTITYTIEDENITYSKLGNIVAQCLGNNMGGTFTVNIMAHHTDKTSTNKVLAQGTIPGTVTVLPETQISINKGALTWTQTSVMQSSGRDYINEYELEIIDDLDNKFVVKLKNGDYKLTNHVASYELPSQFVEGEDVLFAFDTNAKYTFKLRAMAGEGVAYINSTQTSIADITLLPILSVTMNNGVLTWTNPTTNSVQVNVSYESGGSVIVYESIVNTNEFNLPRIFTDIYGTSGEFTADYNYNIKVRLYGGNSQLSGFYSEPMVVNRLKTVKQLSTQEGTLKWEASSVEGVKYKVFYLFGEATGGSVWSSSEELEITEYKFEGLNAGAITAYVQAYHNDYFASFGSENIELFKLSVPSNIKFNEGTNIISWDKVLDKNGAEVNHYSVIITVDGEQVLEQDCSSNEWEIDGVETNKFSIAVRAISIAENDGIINGEYSDYVSMEQPEQVDATTFKYNSELNRFEWEAIANEQSADKYYIGYNYYKTVESAREREEVLVSSYQNVGGKKTYYYEPSKMGVYRQIYVLVKRADSLSSQATYCVKDGANFVLSLTLFASGDGKSEQTAYVIETEQHLRNIQYFPSSYYKITANINLTIVGSITDGSVVFSGCIDGGNYYINNYVATSTGLLAQYSGLFAKAENAIFKNINISAFTINGNVNSQNLYLGVLVGYAEGCSFDDVVIASGSIRVVKDNNKGYVGDGLSIHIGGLAGEVVDSYITNCQVVINSQADSVYVSVESNSSTWVYVGGIAGSVEGGDVESCSTEYNIRHILNAVEYYAPNIAIGTLVGRSTEELGLSECSGKAYKYVSSTKSDEITEKIGKVS